MMSFQRYEHIVRILQQQDHALVEQLCGELQASPATIRRDLKELEIQGRIHRFHGGARLADQNLDISGVENQEEDIKSLEIRLEENAAEKERIAAAALKLVAEGDVIALTGGSTSIYLAQLLKSFKSLTVVTNSISTALALEGNIEVILIGGKLNPASKLLVGPIAEETLSKIRIGKVLMGVDAIDIQYGITVHNFSEAHIDRVLARCANEIIIIADHTKFSKILFTEVIPIGETDRILTGKELGQHSYDQIAGLDIEITRV